MRKELIIFIIALLTIIGVQRVDASTYNGKLYEEWDTSSGVNVYAAESNGYLDYNSWMIKSTIDSKIYYCIEPGYPLTDSPKGAHTIYNNKTDIINNTALTEPKYKKVQLLAYYGYGYKDNYVDHTSKKWYGITQVMIWRVMRPDLTWTFKKTRGDTPNKDLYKTEVAELNKLVTDYDKDASFNMQTHKLLRGTTIEVKDTNKVLYQYQRDGINNKILTTQVENKLSIYSEAEPGTYHLGFKLKPYTNEYFGAFVSSDFQDVIKMGQPPEKWEQLLIEAYGGIVSVQKNDEEKEKNITQGEATFKGAVYEFYDDSNTKKGQVTTDNEGKGKISLDYGKYTIKESKAPKGYTLSNKIYEIEISKDNPDINLNVFDKVIKGKVILTKLKGGTGEEYIKEQDATFEITDKNDKVVDVLKTNKNGIDVAVLPYGTYKIKQISGEEGYAFAKDKTLIIKENKVYEIELKNVKLSRLEFSKTDYSTSKPVPDTLVEIYKENDELVYQGRTDKDGKISIPSLEIGNYYILEKQAPEIYKLNKEKMFFKVKENGKIIKANMKNYRKEGSLEVIKIDKNTKKALSNAEFDLYFDETGKIVYSGKTNKNGNIKIDKLVLGSYCIIETKAPKGYILDKAKKCFKLKEENQTVKVVLENSKTKTKSIKEIIKVPNTSSYNIITIVSAFIIIASSVYLIYEKKN